jgi:hypothetical protein
LQPKNNSDPFKWSKICYIKFKFDDKFNPVLWLTNDTYSLKLQTPLEESVASLQSGSQAQDDNEVITSNNDSISARDETSLFEARDVWYDWPHGRAVVPVDRKRGLREFIIPNLNLQISVRLQPCCGPGIPLLNLGMKLAGHSTQF